MNNKRGNSSKAFTLLTCPFSFLLSASALRSSPPQRVPLLAFLASAVQLPAPPS
jgi:hypothetical protein